MRRLLTVSVALIVLAALWAVAGASSTARVACISCHEDSPHATAEAAGAHAKVECVACHESGGFIARVTANNLRRFEHVIAGSRGTVGSAEYGLPIASDACRKCHEDELARVLTDDKRGLKMSHAEPLAAGAECVDCHTLELGLVAASSNGMGSCLRCHGKGAASASCDVCHAGDPAVASRNTEATGFAAPAALVERPTCGGCHTSQASCDACHGVRMPHSQAFMAGGGHARAAALDIWENEGRTCKGCHYEGHRPCGQCHSPFPGHPASFRTSHQAGSPANGCTCHEWDATVRGMSFCDLCHADESAAADSAQ